MAVPGCMHFALINICAAGVPLRTKCSRSDGSEREHFYSSVNIVDNLCRRIIQNLRISEKLMEVLENGCVIEAVYRSFIAVECKVHISASYHIALGVQFLLAVLSAKGDKGRQIAEIIQMMHNGRNSQGTHRGKNHRGMEGTDFQQEPRNFSFPVFLHPDR